MPTRSGLRGHLLENGKNPDSTYPSRKRVSPFQKHFQSYSHGGSKRNFPPSLPDVRGLTCPRDECVQSSSLSSSIKCC